MKGENIFQPKISDIKNGGLTGLLTIVIIQPFQVIKTSMIVFNNKNQRIKMLDVIKKIFQKEGILGFYRGFLPSVIKAISGYSIFFGSLEFNKRVLNKAFGSSFDKKKFEEKNYDRDTINFTELKERENFTERNKSDCQILINIEKALENEKDKYEYKYEKNSTTQSAMNFMSSGMARFIQVFSVSPILVIKTRNEVLGFNSYRNLIDAFKQIKNQEGMRGFYTGLKTTLIKDVPASGLFYMSYEFIKKEIKNIGVYNIHIQAIISSTLTSVILVLMTNPLEVIRTRQQYQHFSTNPDHHYNNISEGFYMIYKYEGVNGFFVGIGPRLMKKGFGSIIVWNVYETLKSKN
jgi:solute carrier family 25 protein 38